MDFPHLANFASFLLDNCLDDLTKFNINKSKEVKLPLLNAFKTFTEEQLFAYSKSRFKEFLEGVTLGKAKKESDANINKWKLDDLPQISRSEINAEDIVLLNHVRKYSMLYFLKKYTTDVEVFHQVTLEIEELFTYILNGSIKQYGEILEGHLQKEEKFIGLVMDNTPDGISSFDKDLNITVWNKALETRTGYSKEKLLGKNLLSLLPEYLKNFNKDTYDRILNGEVIKMENQPYLHRDGFYDIEILPIRNNTGDVVGGVSISRDITEWKNTREEISEKNKSLEILNRQLEKERGFSRTLLKSEVNGVVGLDTHLRYTEWNSVMEKLIGKKASEVIGKHVLEIFLGTDETDSVNAFKAALKGESTILTGKKGFSREDFYYDAYIMPLLDDENVVTGVVSLLLDVSEKKVAEQKLVEREHFLESITDISPAIIAIYNVHNGQYKFINKAVFTLLGYQPEEVISKGIEFFFSIMHPDDLTRISQENQKAIESSNHNPEQAEKRTSFFEYRIKHNNGSWKWLKTYGTIFTRDDNNKIESILNISVDITERKNAEKELISKNEIINGILKNLPVVVTRVNKEGIITESMGAGLDILGMKQNEATGINIIDGFPQNIQYTTQILEGKPTNFISLLDHSSGTKYHQNYFFPDQGNGGFIGFSLDITAQNEAEIKLQESQNFIEKIAEIAPFPIGVTDLKTQRPIYINSESLRVLGYTDDEIKARKVDELIMGKVHPDDMEKVRERGKKIPFLKDDDLAEVEFRVSDRHGSWIWFFSRVKVFKRDKDGNVEQFISVSTDITDRKKYQLEIVEKNKELEALLEELRSAEEQLLKTNNDLEIRVLERTQELTSSEEELKQMLDKTVELNEEIIRKNEELIRINNELDNFIYTASHDLKSPIANMEGLLCTMEKSLKGNNEGMDKTIFNMMAISVERLKNTITILTDISKLNKNPEERVEPVFFAETIQDVKKDLYQYFKATDITITEELQISTFNFVKPNFYSIVLNLLSNAVKYRSFDRPLEIVVRNFLEQDYIVFSVKDNGMGINPEHKSKLFMLFRRLHNHVEGTGVGLYIVKRIVENAGGKIEVESNINEGAEFKVYFKKS